MKFFVLIFVLLPITAISNTILSYNTQGEYVVEKKEFLLNFFIRPHENNISCDLTIEWGDGQIQKVNIGKEGKVKTIPLSIDFQVAAQIPHTYEMPGKKIIKLGSPFFWGCDIDRQVNDREIKVLTVIEKEEIDKEIALQKQIQKETNKDENKIGKNKNSSNSQNERNSDLKTFSKKMPDGQLIEFKYDTNSDEFQSGICIGAISTYSQLKNVPTPQLVLKISHSQEHIKKYGKTMKPSFDCVNNKQSIPKCISDLPQDQINFASGLLSGISYIYSNDIPETGLNVICLTPESLIKNYTDLFLNR